MTGKCQEMNQTVFLLLSRLVSWVSQGRVHGHAIGWTTGYILTR
jgi:hypothetical protein